MRSIIISKNTTNNIKALACLLIVAHHYCSWMTGKGYGNWIIDFIGVRGGVAGVTIFFFLSAWGLSESQCKNSYTFGKFVKKRLSKVYIPLVISSSFYYFYLLLSKSITFNLGILILNVSNIRPIDGVLWFCNAILIFYIIFYISFHPRKNWVKATICITGTVLYSVLATYLYPDAPFYVYSIIGFPFGMICSIYKDRVMDLSFSVPWSLLTNALLLIGVVIFPNYKNLFLMNFFSFLLIVLVIIATHRVHTHRKLVILPFIGLYSYEIYLIHNKVLTPIGNSGHIIWYPVAFVLMVIPLSVLLQKLIKVVIK